MPSVARLVRRDGMFYFRMAVPRRLVARVGRSEIKASLRTTDATVAKLRNRLLSNAFDIFFKRLPFMPLVTTAAIDTQIREYFQVCLNESLELSQIILMDTRNDIDQEIASIHNSIALMRRNLGAQSFDASIRRDASMLVETIPVEAQDRNLEVLQYVCSTVLRAKIESARILTAQLGGQHDETAPKDPLFIGMAPTGLPPILGEEAPILKKAPTLRETANLFLNFKAQHDFAAKTLGDVKRVLELAYDVIGAEKPVRSVSTDDIKALRDLLAKLPPNYLKAIANAGQTAQQAAAQNASGQALSLQTQEKYLRMFKSVLAWATDEGYIEKTPGQKVKVAGANKLKGIEARLPYSATQLKKIFASPLYTGHKSLARRADPGVQIVHDGKFWTPLIALYSGMRSGEILQLLASDVKEENGIWYFDVSKGEDEDKKIKTVSSIRRVPIHRTLIDFGLLDASDKLKPKNRIFADIECGSDGYYSHNFSKWWGRYSRQVGFRESKTAFHSFRHNFKDALVAAQVPEAAAKALMGHADKSVHGHYGSGPTLDTLKMHIDKVAYPIILSATPA